MTKEEISNVLADKVGLTRLTASRCIDVFTECVKNSLEHGENVYLRGFGSFIIKPRAEKVGRNPTNGIAVNIPAHNAPVFKAARDFKSRLRNHGL